MQRIFGIGGTGKRPEETGAAIRTQNNTRIADLDTRISALDSELRRCGEYIRKTPNGNAKENARRKGQQLLQQKRMLEGQRTQLQQQTFNLDQADFARATLQTAEVSTRMMKDTNRGFKQQLRKIDIGKIEKMRDELEEFMEESNEIQEVMSRSYGTDTVDEDDLDAELEALGEEAYDFYGAPEAEPFFLSTGNTVAAFAPSVPSENPRLPSAQKQQQQQQQVFFQ
jgi:charged multivesicular body protein 5